MKRTRWAWTVSLLAVCLGLSGYGRALSAEDGAGAIPEGEIVTGMVEIVENPDLAAEDRFPEAEREDWQNIPVIAHAMGTVDGRRNTNSLDAFLESYEAGQRVFEVDLQLTGDGHLVARHDWDQISYYNLEQIYAGVMDYETFRNTPICFFYTPLDIEGLVSLLQDYPDIYLVTDSKESDEETVRAQVREIARAVKEAGDDTLWERLIVQIYHEEMYDWVSQEAPITNWIFTLYQLESPDYEEIGTFCQERDIPVVTVSAERLNGDASRTLRDHGCRVYVHTVNQLRAMLALSWGADGFYSDYVTPAEWKAVLTGTNRMTLQDMAGEGSK